MAAARVLHFGYDDCHRVPLLRAAGYEVREAHSLHELRIDLILDHEIAAVFVSEDDDQTAEHVSEVARPGAPVILFRRSQREIDESKFDQVYEPAVAPAVWLTKTAALIAKGRALQQESQRLQAEVAALRAEARRQRDRAPRLLEVNEKKS